ncbi:TPA: hypothetical protein ACRNIH_001807 [Pseudomonas aeruginosa]
MPRIALVLGVLLVSACAQPVTPDSIVEESFSRSASERQLEELSRQGLPYEQYRLRRQRILGR